MDTDSIVIHIVTYRDCCTVKMKGKGWREELDKIDIGIREKVIEGRGEEGVATLEIVHFELRYGCDGFECWCGCVQKF